MSNPQQQPSSADENTKPPPQPANNPPTTKPVIRRRLEPSEKQLKQQKQSSTAPQRQRSFQQTQTIMAGLYDLEETLGKGHFATVKAAKHVFTGERVAVKVIDKTKLDTVSQKALLKEVLCMKLVQHPNVVRLYEVIDTSTKMYLVLELGQGDLYDLILKQKGGLPEPQARTYFKQILKAVSYCHKLHVAHRDLKPENVVYFPPRKTTSSSSSSSPTTPTTKPLKTQQHHHHRANQPNTHPLLGQLKLTDFGFSNKFCPGVKLDTSCGSLAYSAPEILLGDSYDAPAVDIWSLGVILYMLAVGTPPFQEANDSETLTMIMDVKYSLPDHLSPELKELIRRMLVRDPRRRAKLFEIERNSWVRGGGDDEDGQEIYEEEDDDVDGSEELHDDALSCRIGTREATSGLPLIASNTLSELESERIFNEMVKGGIVSHVDEVKSSLHKNAYNHVTSTYYLLAERYLRNKKLTKSTTSLSSSSPQSSKLMGNKPDTKNQPDNPQNLEPIILPKRKNSHQFEDITLPSQSDKGLSSSPTSPPATAHYLHHHHIHDNSGPPPSSPDYLDLETRQCTQLGSPTKSPTPPPSQSSTHHPHYYHHIKRFTPPKESQSPPKYCNSYKLKPHHSLSDSSDDGGGGGGGAGHAPVPTGCSSGGANTNIPSINISSTTGTTTSPTTEEEVCNNNNYEDLLESQHNRPTTLLLRPSQTYEEIVAPEQEEVTKKKKSKQRVFLSWFFKRAGGGKLSTNKQVSSKQQGSSSSGANGIYKTRSCAELKVKSCVMGDVGGSSSGAELLVRTRDCVGVSCNGIN